MRYQVFAARLALAALVLAVALAILAVAGVRLGLFVYQMGLTLMTGATALGLIALLAALAWLLSALRRNSGEGRRCGLGALVIGLLFLWTPLHNLASGLAAPPITDIASDPDDPPRFVALARLRKPGMNSPQPQPEAQIHYRGETNTAAYMLHTYYGQTSPTPITKPHAYLLKTVPKMYWHAFETVKKLGWRIVDYNPAQGRIEATDTSFWFGQTADIAVRVQPAGAIGARVDVRAQSESGPDFGSNIQRLKRFFDAFQGGGY